ncbi:MAG: hypothetical protein RL095_135 [Verrucomicrobiota bacterium]|jgi:general secretion pathway protein E/type IV pilus assembly protein PilB
MQETIILDILQEMGALDAEVRSQIESYAEAGGISHEEALEALNIMSVEDCQLLVADAVGVETVRVEHLIPSPEALALLPAEYARKNRLLPLNINDGVLTVATDEPSETGRLDSLGNTLGFSIAPVSCPRRQLEQAIEHWYSSTAHAVTNEAKSLAAQAQAEAERRELSHSSAGTGRPSLAGESQVALLVDTILSGAVQAKASDIHIEPLQKRLRVRYRIDGVLAEAHSLSSNLSLNIISRIKVLGSMNIAEKRLPQDGRIDLVVQGKQLDLRVSSIPTPRGESVVMRILDRSSVNISLSELGFFSDDLELIEKTVKLPNGIFLVTGPTGSGKTTSLYAFLNTLNNTSRKIITAEDPVEYEIRGIDQVQVNHQIGLSFAAVLRSMLRQAPNVIMVGEIRDFETAQIAVQAALTGHMVFSTLHTNDAPGAIARLIDLGCQPFLIATAVRAVMAQRLMRRICSHCSAPWSPGPEELDFLEAGIHSGQHTIVVADPDPESLRLARTMLSRMNLSVITCSNGFELSTLLASRRARSVDMVITSLEFPDIAGVELLDRINALKPKVPMILITDASLSSLEKIGQYNIRAELSRPLSGIELIGVMNRQIKRLPRKVISSALGNLDLSTVSWKSGRGCSLCRGGYKGRLGIYEILRVSPEIEEMILKRASTQQIRTRACDLGMRTLRDDGIRKAIAGLTTLHEVMRLTVENELEQAEGAPLAESNS